MAIIEEMNRFSIRDIENLTGIKAHTIRIWEQRYGILQPKRTNTNIRYYDALDLKMALRIALLNNYGYKISRIGTMNEQEMNSLITKITDQQFKLQLIVNELLESTLSMDTVQFEMLLNSYLKKHGIEQTIEQLIFNFLEKIGLMWMTDRIFPAQEHLVSNIIYRKLALGIEQLLPVDTQQNPILLFLPEGEIHDIGLQYVNYLLLKNGRHTIYLGPNSPINEVQFVYETCKPQSMYLHLTSIVEDFDANKYLDRLATQFAGATIYVSGAMLNSRKYKAHNNMQFLYNLQEARQALLSL